MKQKLKSLQLFNEIDFAFADYIASVEQSASTELYLASLCVSYAASLQHSALSLSEVHGKRVDEFCADERSVDIFLDFSGYQDWPMNFPKTIGVDGEAKPLILDTKHGILYLNKYFKAEKRVAECIKQMACSEAVSVASATSLNRLFRSEMKPDWQKVAAFTALRSRFCIISGGPGTGKTTTVAKILALLLQQNKYLSVDLLAPTGKAADRLGVAIANVTIKLVADGTISSELAARIPQKASTLHRYLGTSFGSEKFAHNEKKPTASDVVLIDESSMVSLPLFHALLKALKKDCRLILLGDKDQLAAVENGNVFGELTFFQNLNTFSNSFCEAYTTASQEKFNFVSPEPTILQDLTLKLEYSYRFGPASPVGRLSKLINEPPGDLSTRHFKELFSADYSAEEYVSFTQIPTAFDDKSLRSILSLNLWLEKYKQALKSADFKETFKVLNECRLLTATRVGLYGSDMVNRQISRTFFYQNDNELYHGRCIMMLTNDQNLGLYNGDVGVILKKDGVLVAFFPDKNDQFRFFSPAVLGSFTTAFATTIHKSQGSEYKRVIVLLPDGNFITRQLVYTGITRARQSVEVISQLPTLVKAANNSMQRFSGLRTRLD